MITFLGLLTGFLYVNFLEWLLHRFVLHGLGKRKSSIFNFHIVHHYVSSACNMKDSPSLTEAFYMTLVTLMHFPVVYISMWLYIGAVVGGIFYWVIHSLAHIRPDLMYSYLPWHHAHHTWCPNHNWCVTYPLFDIIFRTYRR